MGYVSTNSKCGNLGLFGADIMENQKTQKEEIKPKKIKKKTNKLSKNTKYFDFYDDIKASCHKITDW